MKFGKEFKQVIEETQPELRDKFLRYKELKKCLKGLPPAPEAGAAGAGGLTNDESAFVRMLHSELVKFNDFFIEREEEMVMMERQLETRMDAVFASGYEAHEAEFQALAVHLARFHGEVVMLENWCFLNYAGLVKILKKHDKQSRLALRSPILVKVLRQPFYSTEVLRGLVKRTEERFRSVSEHIRERRALSSGAADPLVVPPETDAAPENDAARGNDAAKPMLPELLPTVETLAAVGDSEGGDAEGMLRSTQAAINLWQSLGNAESLKQPFGPAEGRARDDSDTDAEQDCPAGKRVKVAA